MKTMMTVLLALTVMGGATAQASYVLIDDDFGSSAVSQQSRFYAGKIDSGLWVKRDSNWSVTGGVLTNPAVVVDDEKGVHLINSVASSDPDLTMVTVSFDYSVGEGTTLYFFSSLFTGQLSDGSMSARLVKTNGAWYGDDFNSDTSSYGGFLGPDYNLKNGATPSGDVGTELASFVGPTSGTFNQTYDISGFGGGGFSLADVSHVLAVFTSDNDTSGGAISIDNFIMAGNSIYSKMEFIGAGTWDDPSKWTGGVLPGSDQIDIAAIEAGDNCTVTNPVAPANSVHTRVRGGTGVLNVQDDFSSNGGNLWVGHAGAMPGNLNHSAGTVNVNALEINGVDGSATYNLTGGILDPTNSVSINTNGTILVDGGIFNPPGTVTINEGGVLDIRDGVVSNASKVAFSGNGMIVQTGGVFTLRQGSTSTDALGLETDMVISGGAFICGGRLQVGRGGPVELTVVGRGATISIYQLYQNRTQGTFRFVLDEGGVSPVDGYGNYMILEDAKIRVDGANFDPFTGSQRDILLFKSNNMITESTDMTYTNFHPRATLEFVYESNNLYLRYTPPLTGTVILVN